MKTNMTATLVLSTTLGVALAFAAAAVAIVLLPSNQVSAVSPYGLVSVTQEDLMPGPALASAAVTTTLPPTDARGPAVVPSDAAVSPVLEAPAARTVVSQAITSTPIDSSSIEQTAPEAMNVVAAGGALLAQVTRNGLPDVRAAGAFVAAQLRPLMGE